MNGGSQVNGSSFLFEELQTIKTQLQQFRCSSSKVNGPVFVFEELQTIRTQLQTISKLELEGKWVLVRFRGTTNDKSTTTNDFGARSWDDMT